MQQEILRLEKEVEQQRTNVHEKEKKIRNSENILLRK
jgi:flagellar biosynthesis chaperone FliJ